VISIVEPSRAGPSHFLVSERFDLVDARAIHRALAAAGADAAATIDFRGARHSDPVAVAQLARDIAARPGRLAIIGMGHHDHRLLDYLGRSREARSPPGLRPERLAAGAGPALVDAP
jgi:Mg-chelatase subunit ChlI